MLKSETLCSQRYRSLATIAFLVAMGTAMVSAQGVSDQPQSAVEQASIAKTADRVAEEISFDEARAIGESRSKYRKSDTKVREWRTPKPQLADFRSKVGPILNRSCVSCHGSDLQEGSFRVDTLNPDLLHGDDVDWWIEVMDVLSNGEMPPPDETQLNDQERSEVIDWLSTEIQIASSVRRSEGGHSSFRRMTKYEFNYALQDLLSLPYDFAKDLTPDSTSEDGFQNSSEMLHISAIQFDSYQDLSRQALHRATVRGAQPSVIHWDVSMRDASAAMFAKQQSELDKAKEKHADDPEKLQKEQERLAVKHRSAPAAAHYLDLESGKAVKANWNYRGARFAIAPTNEPAESPTESSLVAIIPTKQRLIIELGNSVPDDGILRVRVRACRANSEGESLPSLRLEFGWQASNNSAASVRVGGSDKVVDASPGEPAIYEWEIHLSEIYPRNPMRNVAKMGDTPNPSEFIKLENSCVTRSDIQIEHVQVSAPVYEHWPPQSHRKILHDVKHADDEEGYARDVLSRFLPKAWRREVSENEIEKKLSLFRDLRPHCDTLEDAVMETLASALASPNFLYLARSGPETSTSGTEGDQRLTCDELATRLSMFLWCSIPDEELRDVAANGQLLDHDVLLAQTERMLIDTKSRRFSREFVRGWLGMQLLDYLDVDRKVYPGFDRALRESMQEEPVELFHAMLMNDNSVVDFIHADYAVINERLARHYGVPAVQGNQFQRVSIEPEHKRGGLLTQAGLLAMNSDGKDSHPLKRGIWMLERLLNAPPPPPPPAVPEIDLADPEIAKMTLKERIDDHRNHAACMSCHAKIDPWGIAFENFDAVGSWRLEIQGRPVDASSRLFNGQPIDGIDGLKRFLLEHRQDQFVRATVHKLVTFAVGRPLTFADRSDVEKITAAVRKQDDGLSTMVRQIVLSDLFLSK